MGRLSLASQPVEASKPEQDARTGACDRQLLGAGGADSVRLLFAAARAILVALKLKIITEFSPWEGHTSNAHFQEV